MRLTSFSEASGCGCKLPQRFLDEMLKFSRVPYSGGSLLVGNANNDDASVYRISESQGIISSVDFSTPIVDDPFMFGQIAAAHSLSDIYAMGGSPCFALAILGLPIPDIPAEIGAEILRGAASVCESAGVVIAGGHSIINPQPIFGLAATGLMDLRFLKTLRDAKEGDALYLTKPLGTGILSAANKVDLLEPTHLNSVVAQMVQLNDVGILLVQRPFVHVMTDVSGFGLLGQIVSLCRASALSARITHQNIPICAGARHYLVAHDLVTGGGKQNWQNYRMLTDFQADFPSALLCDPQTSGGLLIAGAPEHKPELESIFARHDTSNSFWEIGHLCKQEQYLVYVE